MGSLIDDLLRLSRISRQEMRIAQIDLSVLVWEVVGELQAAEPGGRCGSGRRSGVLEKLTPAGI